MTGPQPPFGEAPDSRPNPAAMPFGASPKGTVLDGRYLLEGRIATGGMGEVWRGLDQTLGRPVAVKLLRPEYASDESFLVRFRGEARHAARVSHPGVASVYDYGEVITDGDRPTAYLVMELVEGEPLSALLHREKRLSPEKTLDVLGQAADALQAAHALGVVHRDVKPGNLLLRTDGAVKVTDFGIARAVDAAPLTATGIMMGTAYYVSPEQASGRPVTPASDVYSLGVVAYECLAGRRPFDDRNPIVVVMAHQQDDPPPLPPDVPDAVRNLVEAAMAKDPGRRPASAGSFGRTAAAIRRNLWNADMTRRGVGPMPVPRSDAGGEATLRRHGPNGPSTGFDPTGAPPVPDRPPSWTRQRSWAAPPHAASPHAAPSQEEQARWDAPSSWDVKASRGLRDPQGPPASAAGPTAAGSATAGSVTAGSAATSRPDVHPANASAWQQARADRTPTDLQPWEGRAVRRRAHGGNGAPATGGRRLSLPILIILLIVTVTIAALITRTIAGSGRSSQGAPPLTWVVHASGSGGGIVTGGSTTGDDRVSGGPATTTTRIGPGVRGQFTGTSPGSGKASTGGSRD